MTQTDYEERRNRLVVMGVEESDADKRRQRGHITVYSATQVNGTLSAEGPKRSRPGRQAWVEVKPGMKAEGAAGDALEFEGYGNCFVKCVAPSALRLFLQLYPGRTRLSNG